MFLFISFLFLIISAVNDINKLEKDIEVKSVSALKIPLTSQVIDIALEKSSDNDKGSQSEQTLLKDRFHDSLVFIGIVLIVIVIVLLQVLV